MKKSIGALVGLALAGMMWMAQAADVIAPQKSGVSVIKAERQTAQPMVAKKIENVAAGMGMTVDDKRKGSGVELSKMSDRTWKSAKVDSGNWWKSASDSGTLKQASSILSGTNYTSSLYASPAITAYKLAGMKSLSSPSFALAMTTASSPPRDLLATSFTSSDIAVFQGEKTLGSHAPETGIPMTVVNGFNYGTQQLRLT